MSLESEAIQRAAAEFIHDRHRLGAFMNELLRDAHVAEDVLQEVWVRLAAEVEKSTRLDNQAAWCRGVARNLIRRHWEQQQSAKVVADSASLETFLDRMELAFAVVDDDPDDWASSQQTLDECVAALPERSRQMLTLGYESRGSMEGVAAAVNSTAPSACGRRATFRVFDDRPGHETYPVFRLAEPLRVVENAVRWLSGQ